MLLQRNFIDELFDYLFSGHAVDIALKQRLVGAVVLISLAVIFLPMVFTGKGNMEEEPFKTNIPPEPIYEINAPSLSETKQFPSKTLERVPLAEPVVKPRNTAKEIAEIPVTKTPAKSVQKEDAKKKQAQSVDSSTIPVQSKQTATLKKPEESSSSKLEPKDTQPSVASSSVPIQANKVQSGWVVQVGSFTKKTNAVTLRDQLRKMQMPSFVAKGQSKKGPVYRVRVGPVLKRQQAEQLQQKILEETKLKGYVTNYP